MKKAKTCEELFLREMRFVYLVSFRKIRKIGKAISNSFETEIEDIKVSFN